MITSILNAGFGHSVRFIAMMENLRKYNIQPAACLVSDNMRKFIQSNVSSYNCSVYNLYDYFTLANKLKNHTKTIMHSRDKNSLKRLQNTKIIINDFITHLPKIRHLFPEYVITSCLYHGDIHLVENEDQKIKEFKELVCHTAAQHDIFFHIQLEQPQYKPSLSCAYIPIPIVCRSITADKTAVKQMLGLSPDEPFILIHAGSAVMENLYRDLHAFYTAVNNLKIEYRIVISSGIENNKFTFHSGIIRAPLFNNGMDLINASELVISKPGMGILQDCIACKTPLFFLPGDFPERDLKVQLLDRLLIGQMPYIKEIHADNLKHCINQCISLKSYYEQRFATVPTNGADILAKALDLLHSATKDTLHDTILSIRQMSPFL